MLITPLRSENMPPSATSISGTAKSTVSINASASGLYHKVVWQFGERTHEEKTSGSSASFTVPTNWLDQIPAATSGTASPTDEQQANRTYMSQVNETMVELDGNLDSFVDAVSRGDVVNMKTQADNAYKVLDKLSELEAPEALSDVHKKYVEGTQKLEEALDAYIQLYTEAEKAGKNFEWSGYDERLKEIQDLYDSGIKALEEGDKAASEA